MPKPNFFVVLVFRPCSERPLEPSLYDVHEPGLMHEILVRRSDIEGTAEGNTRLDEQLAKAVDLGVFGHAAIIAAKGCVKVLELEVAAGLKGTNQIRVFKRVHNGSSYFGKTGTGIDKWLAHLLVGFFDVSLVVGKAPSHDATEDEIKGRSPGPLFLKIIELELAVWWDTAESLSAHRAVGVGCERRTGWAG